MIPTHSALLVPIPEAEPLVAAHRDRLDRAASWGVPAHITVLYPFLAPAQLTEPALAAVRQVVAQVPGFFLSLTGIRWFTDRVVWAAPEPAEPFRRLTAALFARFPQCPPFGGEFDDVVPHLTIGHDHPAELLRAAGDEVAAGLPVRARATTVRLMTGARTPGATWSTLADFPLG